MTNNDNVPKLLRDIKEALGWALLWLFITAMATCQCCSYLETLAEK